MHATACRFSAGRAGVLRPHPAESLCPDSARRAVARWSGPVKCGGRRTPRDQLLAGAAIKPQSTKEIDDNLFAGSVVSIMLVAIDLSAIGPRLESPIGELRSPTALAVAVNRQVS